MRLASSIGTLAAILMAQAASAHFVWVAVEPASGGQPTVNVWFSELAEPDSAELLDRITKVKVWTRTPSGAGAELSLAKKIKGDGGAWIAPAPIGTSAISAHLNYGVLSRGKQTFLLHYHAKYLNAAAKDLKAIARDEKLAFDIVPTLADGGVTLEILYGGQPAKDAEVVILDPTTIETTTKADAAGRVALQNLKAGLYSIRAKWVVMEPGNVGDKEYSQVNHYSTLALRIPPSLAGQKEAAAGGAPLE